MRSRELCAEVIGTAFLLMAVVGSGIMGERLAGGNVAIALLANTLATSATLIALIITLGPVSGAHLNPFVSVMHAVRGRLPWPVAIRFSLAQVLGALIGVAIAHLIFELPVYSVSTHARAGFAQALSEFVATFGLFLVIWASSRGNPSSAPFAIGAYIAGAYWFTASTSFANPAVTIARCFTNTFAGIGPGDVPAFIAAQAVGAIAATAVFSWIEKSN